MPTSMERWVFAGDRQSRERVIGFDASLLPGTPGGTSVWVMARWYSRRMKPWPLALPVSTTLNYEVVSSGGGGTKRAA